MLTKCKIPSLPLQPQARRTIQGHLPSESLTFFTATQSLRLVRSNSQVLKIRTWISSGVIMQPVAGPQDWPGQSPHSKVGKLRLRAPVCSASLSENLSHAVPGAGSLCPPLGTEEGKRAQSPQHSKGTGQEETACLLLGTTSRGTRRGLHNVSGLPSRGTLHVHGSPMFVSGPLSPLKNY